MAIEESHLSKFASGSGVGIRDIRACYTETLQSEANYRHRDIPRGRWAGIESVFSVAKDVEETETTQRAKRIILINSSSRLWLVVRLGP